MRRHGFTLIELLVVVTIITTLLAILLPSISKSIYLTQLTVCASNLRQTGVGVQTYAADYYGMYPVRPNFSSSSHYQPGTLMTPNFPWRDVIKDYIDLNAIGNCSFTGEVDYFTDAGTRYMWLSYNYYFGFKFNDGTGMARVGDSFTTKGNRFNILATDRDIIMPTRPELQSSHPDTRGVMQLLTFQDSDADPWGSRQITATFWSNFGEYQRGTIDQNFLHTDGSVQRYNNVTWDDPRLSKVPAFNDKPGLPSEHTGYSQLPAIGR